MTGGSSLGELVSNVLRLGNATDMMQIGRKIRGPSVSEEFNRTLTCSQE
jgi:hypothetical protein